jgi:thioredoxin 1
MSFTRAALRPVLRLRAPFSARFQSSIAEVAELNGFKELISSPKLTVTDFYATWCGPCKAIAPVLAKFSEEYKDVQFLKVDVDAAQDIAMEYGISAMPTFVLFKDDEPIGKIVGANPGALKKAIEQYK